MTDPIAWVVSTARFGDPRDPILQVRVLCPLCRLIHTHGGNVVSDPRLGGRVSHCGKSKPHHAPAGYQMAWPDDAGAQLLNEQILQCHTIIATHGDLCSRRVSLRRGVGFYCGMHDWHGDVETRVAIDTSSITAAEQESIHTPKFDIRSNYAGSYVRLTPDEVKTWDTARSSAPHS